MNGCISVVCEKRSCSSNGRLYNPKLFVHISHNMHTQCRNRAGKFHSPLHDSCGYFCTNHGHLCVIRAPYELPCICCRRLFQAANSAYTGKSPESRTHVRGAQASTTSVPCHADHLHEHFHEHLDIRIVHVPLAPPSQLVRCDKAWTQASSRSLGTMT